MQGGNAEGKRGDKSVLPSVVCRVSRKPKDGLIIKCVRLPRYISESREKGDLLPKMVECASSKIR